MPVVFARSAGQAPAVLPAAPVPAWIPAPAPATSAPYTPQPILPGGVVIALFPPDSPMLKTERKTARLTLLLDPRKKALFEEICAAQDLTPSQVVRQLIREYIIENAGERALPGWLLAASRKPVRR